VTTFGLGNVLGRCDGLGDSLGLLDLDGLGDTRWAGVRRGRLGLVAVRAEAEGSLVDWLGKR
jgi:hypothetical protein